MNLLLESIGEDAALGAANLASLCKWARVLYDLAAESSQSDADVSYLLATF